MFSPEFAAKYSELHHDLWQRISRLHDTILTLEQLEAFHFWDALYLPNEMEFWRLVGQTLFDHSLMILHALTEDNGVEKHTIPRFKNIVSQADWQDSRLLKLFKQTIREHKFDHHFGQIAKHVKEIRHTHVAHRLLDKKTGHLKTVATGITLADLRSSITAVHGLFGAVSFGSGYATLTGDLLPGTIGGIPKRNCLDEVLDAVLRSSDWVNEPERDQFWKESRQCMDSGQLSLLNEARQRIGLPEV